MQVLIGFSAFVAALSLPSVLVDVLGNLYATAWWVPMSTGAGLKSWAGGLDATLDALATGEVVVGGGGSAQTTAGLGIDQQPG